MTRTAPRAASLLALLIAVAAGAPLASADTEAAAFNEGIEAYQRGDWSAAAGAFMRAPKDAEAQYNLGVLHTQGLGVPQDLAAAHRLFRSAADQGNLLAQSALGYLYASGQGVEADYQQAFLWYRKAAEKGYSGAQAGLAQMYAEGHGVARDWDEAARWYRQAADQGYGLAQAKLADLYTRGDGVQTDYAEAALLYRKSAERGYPAGMAGLGYLYATGKGMPLDHQLAYRWLKIATRSGHADAQRDLDIVAKRLTDEQIAEAERVAESWRPSYPEGAPVAAAPAGERP